MELAFSKTKKKNMEKCVLYFRSLPTIIDFDLMLWKMKSDLQYMLSD